MKTSDTRYHKSGHLTSNGKSLPCRVCKEIVVLGQPDPCLGILPGVAHACCGHGVTRAAYVNGFDNCKPSESISEEKNGKLIYKKGYWVKRGKEALEWLYVNTTGGSSRT
jgi:hypothetical protein